MLTTDQKEKILSDIKQTTMWVHIYKSQGSSSDAYARTREVYGMRRVALIAGITEKELGEIYREAHEEWPLFKEAQLLESGFYQHKFVINTLKSVLNDFNKE